MILGIILLCVIGCNNKSKEIDKFLDALELAIQNDEKLIESGESSYKDYESVTEKYWSEFFHEEKMNSEIMKNGSKAQQERYLELQNRVEKIAANSPKRESQISENTESSDSGDKIASNKKEVADTRKKNDLDAWLDSYEKLVVKFEKAGSNLGLNDVMEINEALAELSEKQTDSDMTPAQANRLVKLINRLTKVMEKAN